MTRRPFACFTAIACLILLQGCAVSQQQLFERQLTSQGGVVGEIHGAYPELDLYVLTYRNPKNFFDFIEVSLISGNTAVSSALAGLHRHDRVRIKGQLLDNPSPQPHVELSELEVVKRYESTPAVPAYTYSAAIPMDLRGKDSALFLVHNVAAGGRILVVEYKDVVLPVPVRRPELTRNLARNDVVRLSYQIRSEPDKPVHLRLREDASQPVEVVDSAMALHLKPAAVEGQLVLFPKSPQVAFNVFAVLQELPGGLRRQYTLANFESEQRFEEIRKKLQLAWDERGNVAVSGRNKLISTNVRVRATGKFNAIDPNQANVQIVLDGADSVEVLGSSPPPSEGSARTR
ncbi:hypothetical protein [Steroidobacter cummioxidans]|uniref:hypothetical protein n=1 Tax=Steroidobacter cummioxidans TaxID=1803913 RepID=UPI00128FCE3C|nr:hypothetical protein [Steroidobacter cummioxidans]